MNKLLLITLVGVLMLGCAAQEEVAAFHPTDDISAQAQGGKGHTSDGSEVQSSGWKGPSERSRTRAAGYYHNTHIRRNRWSGENV